MSLFINTKKEFFFVFTQGKLVTWVENISITTPQYYNLLDAKYCTIVVIELARYQVKRLDCL